MSRVGTFVAPVLLGLAGAVLATVGATRTWAHATGRASGVPVSAFATGADAAPLAAALALVALAAWGVVLVLRGRARRAGAGVGLLAAAGVVLTVALAFHDARAAALAHAAQRGVAPGAADATLTGWYVATGVGGLVCVVMFAVALVHAPGWPTMGTRYDAPVGRSIGHVRTGEASQEELWRALDDGQDPTS